MNEFQMSIAIKTRYVEEQSAPDEDRYVFAYTIQIRNTGQASAQLISRHWVITDANGTVNEVRGLGVVGHQPLLRPGEEFEYSSGTAFGTATGVMRGEYFFVGEDGRHFEAQIPEFTLQLPRTLH